MNWEQCNGSVNGKHDQSRTFEDTGQQHLRMIHARRGLDKTTHPQVHSFRQYNTPRSHRGRWHNLTADRLSKQQWVGDWESRFLMAHQHNQAIQCHSSWLTLENDGSEDELKTDTKQESCAIAKMTARCTLYK